MNFLKKNEDENNVYNTPWRTTIQRHCEARSAEAIHSFRHSRESGNPLQKRAYKKIAGQARNDKALLFSIFLFFIFHFSFFIETHAQCPNLNFSMGNFTNWQAYVENWDIYGQTPPIFDRHTIMDSVQLALSNQLYDEICPSIPKVPPGFAYSAKVGGVSLNNDPEAIKYTMTVDSSNALLTMHIALMLQYLPLVAYYIQPGFFMYIFDTTSTAWPGKIYSSIGIYAQDTIICGNFVGYMQNWRTYYFNLYPLIGRTIDIFFSTRDELTNYTPRAFAYAYIVAECGTYDTTRTTKELKLCQYQTVARMEAPEGYDFYTWTRSSDTNYIRTTRQLNVQYPLDGEIFTCKLISLMAYSIQEIKYIIKKATVNSTFAYGVKDNTGHVDLAGHNYENWYDTATRTATFVDFSTVRNTEKDSILWEVFNPSDSLIASSKDSLFTYTFPEIASCQPALTYRVRLSVFASDSVCYGIDTISRYVTIFPLPADTLIIEDSICPNNAYNRHGFNILASELQTAGEFEFENTLTSSKGCDSLVILQLTVFPKPADTLTIQDSLCINNTYNLHGFNILASELQTAGEFEFQNMLSTAMGCDSLIILQLTVFPEPSIQSFTPTDTLFVCEGEEASMEVQATGKDLVYQWYRNGAPLSGAVNSCYLIPSVSSADFGAYYVEVSGFCGSVKSGVLFLSECIIHQDTCLPFDQIVKMRWNNTLTVINNPANNGGYRFTSYKWYRNNKKISEEQSWSVNDNGEWLNPNDEFYVELTAEGYSGVLRTCKSKITLRDIPKVYPNPTSGQLIIHLPTPSERGAYMGNIEIFNVMGQTLMTLKTLGTIETIDISHLAKGMYFLKIQTGTETFMQKVVRE